MAVSLRASSSNSNSTGTAISVSAPTGTTTDDLVVCLVHGNGQTTLVDNNGSTSFTEPVNDYKPNTSSGHTVSVFYRRIVGGDPSTYNFTLGASGRWAIVALTFQGVHADNFDVAPSTSNAANTDDGGAAGSIDAPSITTLTNNAIHVVAGFWDTSATGTISNPAGYTNASSIATNQPIASSYKVIASASATGSQTVSNTEFASRIALSFAIKDAGTATTSVKDIIGGFIPFAR